MVCSSLYTYKLKLTNIQRAVTQQEINPVKHHITDLKMFISRHVILALTLVCSASKHSGTDSQASWHGDRYAIQVVNVFLPKAWIQIYRGLINLHLTFYGHTIFQCKCECKFCSFVYREAHVETVQFCTLLHMIGVLQLEQAEESLCKEAEIKDPQLKRKIWTPSSPTHKQ